MCYVVKLISRSLDQITTTTTIHRLCRWGGEMEICGVVR